MELLAQRLNLAPSTISFHLLEDVGAVASRKEQYYSIYSINEEVFKSSILDIIGEVLKPSFRDSGGQLQEEGYRELL